jgi:hypothetical protein
MGRDNPDFEDNVKVATEFGNLTTFLHILYAYCNYNTLNPLDPLEYGVLIDLSSKNSDKRVAKFIESIEEFFENKEFYPRCEEICDTTDDESSKEYKRKFYKHVKEFAKVSQ